MAYQQRGSKNDGDDELNRRIKKLTMDEYFDMSNIIECPVCLDVCSPPSYVCEHGHLLCGECFLNQGIRECPICRSKTLTKSHHLDKFLKQCETVACTFKEYGCKNLSSGLKMKDHEIACVFGQIKCPDKMCIDGIPRKELQKHVLQKHAKECYNLTAFVSVDIEKYDSSTVYFTGFSGSLISFSLTHNSQNVFGKAKYVGASIASNISFNVIFEHETEKMSFEGSVSNDSGDNSNNFQTTTRALKDCIVQGLEGSQRLVARVNMKKKCIGDSKLDKECPHYNRGCHLICPQASCKAIVPCRICHDEKIKVGHSLDRFQVRTVICNRCGVKQKPTQRCSICKNLFGKYFCSTCNLYDKDIDGSIYFHCTKCGICRRRASVNVSYFHCDKCDICMPSENRNHVCQVRASMGKCFVCYKEKFDSRSPIIGLGCGHYIHEACRESMTNSGLGCQDCY